ncbi:MAG TPA: chloride channel protein [Chloroflexota bacterium]|nr:chloride channel protein [Chloroflexota bacterium]
MAETEAPAAGTPAAGADAARAAGDVLKDAPGDGAPEVPRAASRRPLWRRGLGAVRRLGYDEGTGRLGDFTTTWRVLPISGLAVGLGVLSAGLAVLLLRLIDLFTNLFFFGRLSLAPAAPADAHLGPLVIAVPVAGALLIGLMARFGSERIRGHGIPEAIEAILLNGSRVQPRLAVLKPLSSAVSIGSGGPFGAEGPIIMTGGAFGSLAAQTLHLTSAERKTLLVAGAAAGMSATFAAPVAAVLLAVELLLFEWKPRSLIPVALASATAAAARRPLLGEGPLFPVPPHPASVGPAGLAGCVVAGLLAALLSGLLTSAVYSAEDAFHRLPIHWMWWPAIGGLVVGVGGFLFPQALGVGYSTIGDLLRGEVATRALLGILLVKSVIWAVSLGSGTSGGVLAPLLMLGGALGGLEALVLPAEGAGFWPLISMGAILGGTMRLPFTGVVFALELTHDVDVLLPLLIAVTVAYGCTVLTLRRSILTEKISRRGNHLGREYAVDPLELLVARDVMALDPLALPDTATAGAAATATAAGPARAQRLYPVVDARQRLVGVVTRSALEAAAADDPQRPLAAVARLDPVVAYADETLRVVADRMARCGLTRLPVVDRQNPRAVAGAVSLRDLLTARARALEAEQRRERVLRLDAALPRLVRRPAPAAGGPRPR